jgi:SAM-dependent methyltransferase
MPSERYTGHYGLGEERDRLSAGGGLLERDRTRAVLTRVLPAAPARILDVGGAAGVHARWLADRGYDVTLLDPVPLHVEQALAEAATGVPFAARRGDARWLSEVDDSYAAVLLLGPLYHLVDSAERVQALREAVRVAGAGAPIVAAAINRFAPLLDGLFKRYFDQPGFAEVVEHGLVTGRHDPPPDRWFTLAYLHRSEELAAELAAAGLTDVEVIGLEGPGGLLQDLDDRHADPATWTRLLRTLEQLESEPSLLGVSSHLMGVGRAP